MRAGELTGLARVSAAACEAAEARLAALRRQEAELRAQIASLEVARRERAAEARATDLSVRAGVDLRWERWIGRRSSALVAELARLLAQIEIARDDLARAFGRRSAIGALADQVRADAHTQRARREERGF